jgi:restriction endonuclease Mrr
LIFKKGRAIAIKVVAYVRDIDGFLVEVCTCSDSQKHNLLETIAALATTFQLTEEERQELLPSGLPNVY